MSYEAFRLMLSRHAFSPRDAARAGDIWRLFQDAAVLGSSRRGWGPERYEQAQAALIVREMTVVHHREARFGPPIGVRTWVSTFQRGMFSNRQIRLDLQGEGEHGEAAQPLASATQRWVFVAMPQLKPARAPAELLDVFELLDDEPDIELPAFEERGGGDTGPEHRFAFEAWHTWMDPLDHANHPAYVDWIDEALSRVLAAAGIPAVELVAHAERVTFRAGVQAGERVTVVSRLAGQTADGHAVTAHRVLGADDRLCAEATVVRGLVTDGERLVRALL